VEARKKNDSRRCFQAPMDQGRNKGIKAEDGVSSLVADRPNKQSTYEFWHRRANSGLKFRIANYK